MNGPHDCWRILGIDRASSPAEIKRAYAAQLKAIDRERDVEAFQRLRWAYETALAEEADALPESRVDDESPSVSSTAVAAGPWAASGSVEQRAPDCAAADDFPTGVESPILQSGTAPTRAEVAELARQLGAMALDPRVSVASLTQALESSGPMDSFEVAEAVSVQLLSALFGRAMAWPKLEALARRFHWIEMGTATPGVPQLRVFDWIRRTQLQAWLSKQGGAPVAARQALRRIDFWLPAKPRTRDLLLVAFVPFLRGRLFAAYAALQSLLKSETALVVTPPQNEALVRLSASGWRSWVGWMEFAGRWTTLCALLLVLAVTLDGAKVAVSYFDAIVIFSAVLVLVLHGIANLVAAAVNGSIWSALILLYLIIQLGNAFVTGRG